jgi:hypothetical protein
MISKLVLRLTVFLVGSIPIVGPWWVFKVGVKRGMVLQSMAEVKREQPELSDEGVHTIAAQYVEIIWPLVEKAQL